MILPNHVLFGQKMTPLFGGNLQNNLLGPPLLYKSAWPPLGAPFSKLTTVENAKDEEDSSMLLLGKSLISTRFLNVLSSLNI